MSALRTPNTSDRVIFLHVPRTGGTTLTRIVGRHYPGEVKFEFDGAAMEDSVARYRALSDERRSALRLINGHVPYGIHTLVGPSAYVTMLREPVARVISIFEYIRRRPGHFLHAQVAEMDLREFVESGIHPDAADGQCKWLSGLMKTSATPDPPPRVVPEAMLELAWWNLSDAFVAVGITERFDESLLLYRERLGWAHLAHAKENSLPGRSAANRLPESTLDTVRRANARDLELYKRATAAFDEAIAEVDDLPRQLESLRRANAVRAPWWRFRAGLSDMRRDLAQRLGARQGVVR